METIQVSEKPEITGVFSKEHLLKIFANNAENIKPLLTLFLERTTGQVEEMQGLIENQNWERMYQIAHMIRGSAATLSGMELGQAVCRIENAYKQKNTAEIPAAFSFTVEAFRRFKAAAEEYLHI